MHEIFPARLQALAGALLPLQRRVHEGLTQGGRPAVPARSGTEQVSHALDLLQTRLEALEGVINRDFPALMASDDDQGTLLAYKIAGKLESILDELLTEHHRHDAGHDYPALRLAAIHRHALEEVAAWLDEMLEVIDDPIPALRRRGLPTTGKVDLELTLRLTPAPELAELERYVRAQGLERRSASAPSNGLGFWGWAAVIGLGLWLSGGGCDEGE